jgi:serine/threonine protein kinase
MSSSQTSESISESSDENDSQDENLELNHKILSHYNIIYELGRGAYSIVWLAYCIENSKYYAIKVQHPNEYKQGLDENEFVKTYTMKNYSRLFKK